MKIISIILSFLILFSGVLPCNGSNDDCCGENEITVCDFDNATNNDTNDKDSKDDCGPNCLCVCCGSAYTLFKFSLTENNFYLIANSNSKYISNYAFQFKNAVWHPPTFIV